MSGRPPTPCRSSVSAAGGITGIGLAILSYVILIIAILFIAFAAFLIVFGKIALFVLLSLAPLFISMALFRITSHLFNGWMRACAQYALIPVIVYAFLGFFLVLIQTTITNIQATVVNSTTALTVISPFLLMCLIGFFLLSQILSIVHGIAGGGAMLRTSAAYSLAAAGGGAAAARRVLSRRRGVWRRPFARRPRDRRHARRRWPVLSLRRRPFHVRWAAASGRTGRGGAEAARN